MTVLRVWHFGSNYFTETETSKVELESFQKKVWRIALPLPLWEDTVKRNQLWTGLSSPWCLSLGLPSVRTISNKLLSYLVSSFRLQQTEQTQTSTSILSHSSSASPPAILGSSFILVWIHVPHLRSYFSVCSLSPWIRHAISCWF